MFVRGHCASFARACQRSRLRRKSPIICSRALGASGFHPCLWPSRRRPEIRQPCFSSPRFVLSGVELHGTLLWERRCPCLQGRNCLSQEERWSWFGLRLRRDVCMRPMGPASLWPGSVTGRTPRRSSFQTELQALQSVLLLAVLAGPLCSLSRCPSRPSTRLAPKLSQLDTSPGLEDRRSPPAPTRQCRS